MEDMKDKKSDSPDGIYENEDCAEEMDEALDVYDQEQESDDGESEIADEVEETSAERVYIPHQSADENDAELERDESAYVLYHEVKATIATDVDKSATASKATSIPPKKEYPNEAKKDDSPDSHQSTSFLKKRKRIRSRSLKDEVAKEIPLKAQLQMSIAKGHQRKMEYMREKLALLKEEHNLKMRLLQSQITFCNKLRDFVESKVPN